ncbi:MAG: hypothetical protein ACKKL5_02740 [Candidatus Komeilibacteria bacterium]
MTIRKYLLWLLLATILAWTLWWLVIRFIDPTTGATLALIFFYFTFFLACLGTFTILGYWLRRLAGQRDMTIGRLNIALRQGVLFSLLLNISLWLQSIGRLSWWTGILLIAILSLVEFLFLSFGNRES